jgi:hypothetical protein
MRDSRSWMSGGGASLAAGRLATPRMAACPAPTTCRTQWRRDELRQWAGATSPRALVG